MSRSHGIAYDKAVVLFSGGLDSTVLLRHALDTYAEVRALGFRYGQPHAHAELSRGGHVAEAWGVEYTTLVLADTMNTRTGLLRTVEDHDPTRFASTNAAFVPGRNVIFVATAAAHACAWWPRGNVDVLIGCCAEDLQGFPDCRPDYLESLSPLFRKLYARELRVLAPLAGKSKMAMLCDAAANLPLIDMLKRSWSCYRGAASGPCGTCSACVLRTAAFHAAEVKDASEYTKATGGDPARCAP